MGGFNGLGLHLGNLARLSDARTRSISAENPDGSPGRGGMATEGFGAGAATDLGKGWKVAPAVWIQSGEVFELADITGPGAIQSIWFAGRIVRRECILRFYWDDQEHPSVEVPVSDFFAQPWEKFSQVNALPVSVNPNNGVNCFWEMPFRRRARVTIENRASEQVPCYYQINYALTQVDEDAAYFHAQFRRSNPLPYMTDHTILDGIGGRGHFVGCSLGWQPNDDGWWGEGEIKFYIDGDDEFPTICGTGVEDYFCGSYNFDIDGQYVEYTTPYAGMPQVIRPDGMYKSQQRFGMYRWHVSDPVRFEEDLRVTIQALGWRQLLGFAEGGPYQALQDDVASVAFWYQTLPSEPFPALPERDRLEVI
jgi:hypothetical protein